MRHPKTFRVYSALKGEHWHDYVAAEMRYSEHWLALRDDNGNNLYLFRADTIIWACEILEEGGDA